MSLTTAMMKSIQGKRPKPIKPAIDPKDFPKSPEVGTPATPLLSENDLTLQDARTRGVNDAQAGQTIAATSARLGGDTSSPLFSLLAGGARGGAAAATAVAGNDARFANKQEAATRGLQLDSLRLQKQGLDSGNYFAAQDEARNASMFRLMMQLKQMEVAQAAREEAARQMETGMPGAPGYEGSMTVPVPSNTWSSLGRPRPGQPVTSGPNATSWH